jgi:pullulanase
VDLNPYIKQLLFAKLRENLKDYFLPGIFLVLFFIITFCHSQEKNMLKIHYHRYDNSYKDWMLWTWLDDVQKEVKSAGQDNYGLYFIVDLSEYPAKGNINFLPKYKDWQKKDDPDRFWDRALPHEIWIVEGIGTIYTTEPDTNPAIRKAFLDAPDEVTIVLTHPVPKDQQEHLDPVIRLASGIQIHPGSVAVTTDPKIIKLTFDQDIAISSLPASVSCSGYKSGKLILRAVLDQPEYFTEERLGVIYTPEQTEFYVYAPGAKQVLLNIYQKDSGGTRVTYEMNFKANGLWERVIKEDLKGKYYTYQAGGFDLSYNESAEVIDPYARCVTAHNGRGMIINDQTKIADSPVFPVQDAIIYEVHIRDFTISKNSGVKHKGKYLGFTEENTRIPGTEVKTAVDHLVELGINTVQIMPVQDFENNEQNPHYFWGYMPVNFNAPEGWYATETKNDSRVRECKQLVDALHRKGLKVVLDVVYNHTAETNPLIRYNFNGLAPNFYYRQRPDGSYWNGSACGNEIRSENPMVRRFIVESVQYWVEHYKIDGFRFDLMGLTDLETIREIVQVLRRINPDILLYGEPWATGETPIQKTVKGMQRGEGFAVFNDHFRDALKGPWYNTNPGFLQKSINGDAVKAGIKGSISDFADSPVEVINYVACHDNRTLWDQLQVSTRDDKQITESDKRAMQKLANAVLLTSQGIPFLHSGQEFLRSKYGSENSYNQPDSINEIQWKLKIKNKDVFDYTGGLIKLRKHCSMFRMTDAKKINKNLLFYEELNIKVPQNCIAYKITGYKSENTWYEVVILINPNRKEKNFSLPGGEWNLVVNEKTAGVEVIKKISSGSIIVQPISMNVLYRE